MSQPRVPKVMTVYTEKGGVGKTTITAILARELAKRGHRTVVVDLDSQCSLSQLLLNIPEGKDRVDTFIKTTLKHSLHCHFRQYYDSIGSLKDLDKQLTAPISIDKNLWLIPGSMESIEIDVAMTFSLGFMFFSPHAYNTFGIPMHVIHMMSQMVDAEYVIIDCNPGATYLNRLTMFASDAWLMVLQPDWMCQLALETMETRFTKAPSMSLLDRGNWLSDCREISDMTLGKKPSPGQFGTRIRHSSTPYVFRHPTFLGVVLNRMDQEDRSCEEQIERFAKILKEQGCPTFEDSILARVKTMSVCALDSTSVDEFERRIKSIPDKSNEYTRQESTAVDTLTQTTETNEPSGTSSSSTSASSPSSSSTKSTHTRGVSRGKKRKKR